MQQSSKFSFSETTQKSNFSFRLPSVLSCLLVAIRNRIRIRTRTRTDQTASQPSRLDKFQKAAPSERSDDCANDCDTFVGLLGVSIGSHPTQLIRIKRILLRRLQAPVWLLARALANPTLGLLLNPL